MRLQERHAIVTGAGSGIGQASAIGLAREGARVVAADVDYDAAKKTADIIRGLVDAPSQYRLMCRAEARSRRWSTPLLLNSDVYIFYIAMPASARAIHFLDVPQEEWDR